MPKETAGRPDREAKERELRKLEEEREALLEGLDAIERASKGDESALPAVRRYLDEQGPECLGTVDVARIAKKTQVRQVFGQDLAAREAASRKMELMREEILGPDPSPLEALLADRVVLCWLQLYYAEIKHAEESMKGASSWVQNEWHEKRLDRLQRRYLAAIKSLAQVRRLLGPNVQINVAERQINAAGDVRR